MQVNKIDLAKTISDFLFLNIENPEEKAKKLFQLKHNLDARGHGFEKYTQYYFAKFHNFKTTLNGRTNQQDKGIDVKGIKKVNGVQKLLLVQCKKHNIKDITLNDVKHFYGGIVDYKYEYKHNISIYYITTTKFTQKAKEFLEERSIKAIDFQKISELQEVYDLDEFRKEITLQEGEKEALSCFNKEQLNFNINDDIINSVNATNTEVLQLLKQVRRDLSNTKQLGLGYIAKNDTLELLARKRPHNLAALKNATNGLTTREQNKLKKYGEYFVERLKYLNEEELKVNVVEKDSFLKRLLNI